MVHASFNTETGILDSRFEGQVTLDQIVDYIRATKQNTDYPRTLRILTDATQAQMNLTPEDLSTIVEENLQSLAKYDGIIDGIVLDGPKETALSLLYRELAKTNKYRFEVFSSRENAYQWLASLS